MKYQIKVELSKNGLRKARKKLEFVRDNMETLNKLFIYMSLDYLEERARHYIDESTGFSGYEPTGELMNSFTKEHGDIIGRLINHCFHAAFVEYGTGIVGEGTYLGTVKPGYTYDSNQHGIDGWVYKGTDGNYYWTKGIPAHHYMYFAVNDYLSMKGYLDVFDECFKKVLGGKLK